MASHLALVATRLASRVYPFLPWLGRIPTVLGTSSAIPPNSESILTCEGVTLRLRPDPMWGTLWRQRVYEPFTTKVFRRIVRPGDIVFDVGTNFGWFAALFARWAGPRGHVHAFEPIPFIADIAAETLTLSNLTSRVTLNRAGLGSETGGFSVFTFDGLPLGHASASDLGRSDARAHRCEVIALDEYVQRAAIQNVGFMKLDVEGHELDVLRGASNLLSRPDAPVIYFETNKECLDHRGISAQQLVDVLRSAGYTDFYTFSIRSGFERRESLPDNAGGDHLAFKPAHAERRRAAVTTGRLLR